MESSCHRPCMVILVLKKLIDFLLSVLTFSAAIQAALEKLPVFPTNLALKNFCCNQYPGSMVSFKEISVGIKPALHF